MHTWIKRAVIWSKNDCVWCDRAKALLEQKGYSVLEKKIAPQHYTIEQFQLAVPNARTVPQIFLNDRLIGGYEDLKNYLI